MPSTPPAYWPARILLGIGIAAVGGLILWTLMAPEIVTFGEQNVEIGGALIPEHVAVRALAIAVPLVGLLWMIRIFRGRRDEPPPWRYRDR